MGGASAGSHVNEVHDRLEPGPKPTGGWGAERPPPGNHSSENFALLSEFL